MSLTLTVVGCSDAFGSGARRHTCFLLEADEGRWFVDFGATSLLGAETLGIDLDGVDAVILSHLHGDHFGGLPFLILHAHFVTGRCRPLTIAGPPGTAERVRQAQEVLFPGSSEIDLCFDLNFVEMAPGSRTDVCGAEVECFEVRHPSGAPALALRVRAGGRLFAFSGDTEWVDVLVDVARDADLFVCECYSFDEPIPFHTRYLDIAANRDRLAAGRIMLTHLGVQALARRDEIAGDILVAADGMVVEV